MFEKFKGSRIGGIKGFILLTLYLFIPSSLHPLPHAPWLKIPSIKARRSGSLWGSALGAVMTVRRELYLANWGNISRGTRR